MDKEELIGILNEGATVEDVEQALAGKKALEEVFGVPEAAIIWGKDESTIKKACITGRMRSWECRKSGSAWLVTRAGMRRLFGEGE